MNETKELISIELNGAVEPINLLKTLMKVGLKCIDVSTTTNVKPIDEAIKEAINQEGFDLDFVRVYSYHGSKEFCCSSSTIIHSFYKPLSLTLDIHMYYSNMIVSDKNDELDEEDLQNTSLIQFVFDNTSKEVLEFIDHLSTVILSDYDGGVIYNILTAKAAHIPSYLEVTKMDIDKVEHGN